MTSTQKTFGGLQWWVNVIQYTSVMDGKRWRLVYDDNCIMDFDHKPTMNECMEALITWWNS